jgi:hypothetical protein
MGGVAGQASSSDDPAAPAAGPSPDPAGDRDGGGPGADAGREAGGDQDGSPLRRGAAALGLAAVEETDELRTRRAAVAELGAQVRALVDAVVCTEVPAEELLRVAAEVRELVEPLAAARRGRGQVAAVDDLLRGVRTYNPVTGAGNPMAPPVRLEVADGRVIGTCTLGLGYEGPPMYGHGGISALLLDQILGVAALTGGRPGVTVGLTVRYRRPVPLQTPLRVWGEIAETDGAARTTVRGAIAAADAPDLDLVQAEGTFVSLGPDQARRIFWPPGTGPEDPAAAHD